MAPRASPTARAPMIGRARSKTAIATRNPLPGSPSTSASGTKQSSSSSSHDGSAPLAILSSARPTVSPLVPAGITKPWMVEVDRPGSRLA